jgi:hypothetical protein
MVTEQWTDHEWGPSLLNRQPNQRLECLHRKFILKVVRCVHLGGASGSPRLTTRCITPTGILRPGGHNAL